MFFSKGPTQKSSKYGIGPFQQDKIAKYTGPTQSYQMSELLTNNFCCQKNYCFVELQSFQSYTHFCQNLVPEMARQWLSAEMKWFISQNYTAKMAGVKIAKKALGFRLPE